MGEIMAEEKGIKLNDGKEGETVLDFDVLCATVALQTQQGLRFKNLEDKEEEEEEIAGKMGGVERMWEGGVFDCFDNTRIALETTCCPCYRFGKNMARANLGHCLLQGTIYVFLVTTALINFIAFGGTSRHCFLYLGITSLVTLGMYLGYFRTRIRRQYNIRGNASPLSDIMSHLSCSCCALCQEARTLEINNVQSGVWRGRGGKICIGSFDEGHKNISEVCSLIPTKSPELCTIEVHGDFVDRNSS